jgi:hypothetical protein
MKNKLGDGIYRKQADTSQKILTVEFIRRDIIPPEEVKSQVYFGEVGVAVDIVSNGV